MHGRALLYDFEELCLLEDVGPSATCRPCTRTTKPGRWKTAVRPRQRRVPGAVPDFLGLPPPLRAALLEAHPGIFDAGWWRGVQARLRAGGYLDVAPYPASARLSG